MSVHDSRRELDDSSLGENNTGDFDVLSGLARCHGDCAIEAENFSHKVVQVGKLVDIREEGHWASLVQVDDFFPKALLNIRSAREFVDSPSDGASSGVVSKNQEVEDVFDNAFVVPSGIVVVQEALESVCVAGLTLLAQVSSDVDKAMDELADLAAALGELDTFLDGDELADWNQRVEIVDDMADCRRLHHISEGLKQGRLVRFEMVQIKAKGFKSNDIKDGLPNMGLDFDVAILSMSLSQNANQLLGLGLDSREEGLEAWSREGLTDGLAADLVKLTFDERKSITNDFMCELASKGGLYEEGGFGLEDLLVCVHGVDEESLTVGEVQISDKRCFRMVSRPLAEEFREPRDLKELRGLAKEEGVVGRTGQMSKR